MNRQFPIRKKEAEMDKNYFIKCSLSQVIREIHGKTLRFLLAPVRMAIIKIFRQMLVRFWEKRKPYTVLAAVQISVVIAEISLEDPQQAKVRIAI